MPLLLLASVTLFGLPCEMRLVILGENMTARKRTDAEEIPELPEDTPKPDYGGLGTMIAREMPIEMRRARARREFYRIEHVNPTVNDGDPESKFLGLYRVMGDNGREYDVLIRDPNP